MFPDWAGRTVLIIASGPSALSVLPAGVDFPTIAINESYRLLRARAQSDAVLYGADQGFWQARGGAREFPGLKICADERAARYVPGITLATIPKVDGFYHMRMIREPVGTIGSGGNSGFQAVNLAVQFGAARILLAGFDFVGGHWHGRHAAPLFNPSPITMLGWRDNLDREAETLASWGVEVLNLSPVSMLRKFRKLSAHEISTLVGERSSPL